MGLEAKAVLLGRTRVEGKALLETEEVIFRGIGRGGGVRLIVKRSDVKRAQAKGGVLEIVHADGTAKLELGEPAAAKWADKLSRPPPSRIDKLGVKPAQRVAVVGALDEGLLGELRGRAGSVETGRLSGRYDLLFFAVAREAELVKLAGLVKHLQPNGALWTVRRKGPDGVPEAAVLRMGRAAGLYDVKVASLSDELTGEKLVIPKDEREV